MQIQSSVVISIQLNKVQSKGMEWAIVYHVIQGINKIAFLLESSKYVKFIKKIWISQGHYWL